MADLKISQLTGATTPLAGTEVLPVVQSSTTKKVSVSDLTAGRSISVSGLTNTGITAGSMAFFSSGQVLSGNATLTWNAGTQQMGFQNAAANAYAYIGTTGAGSNADLSVYMGATEAIRFANAGSIVPKVAGQGINFTANTPAAGMTSQLLNWYEEGTFTVTVTSGSGAITSYTTQGTYVRIGTSVNVRLAIKITSPGTAGGQLTFTGLPFSSYNYSDGYKASTFLVREDNNSGVAYQGFINNNSTVGVIASTNNGNVSWTTDDTYVFQATYRVA